jgi:uncharacterized protein (TIGR03067 family)
LPVAKKPVSCGEGTPMRCGAVFAAVLALQVWRAGVAGAVTEPPGAAALPLDGFVEGIVVDSSGKPLAGVRTFNSGDAATVLSITRLLDKERNMATRMSPLSRVLVVAETGVVLVAIVLAGGLRVAHSAAMTEEAAQTAGQQPAVAAREGTNAPKVVADLRAPGGSAAAIRGAWQAVSMEHADGELPESAVRQLVVVIDEKTFVLRRGGELIAKSPYTVDAGQHPPVIKLTYEGQATQGIWERKGDRLMLCLADVDQALPKKFVVGPGGGKALFVLKIARFERIPLYVMDVDGRNLRCLVSMPDYTSTGSPSWSPDGKRIAFDAYRSVFGESWGDSHVFVANADGTAVRDLGDGAMPSWSPDGKRLALSRYSAHQGVWIMNADGTGAELLDQQGWGIKWCPRANRVAYTTYSGGANLCLRELGKAEGRTLLTRDYRQVRWGLIWSPDGQWIAFKGIAADGQAELAAVHVEGEAKGFKVLLPKAMPGGGFLENVGWGGDCRRVLANIVRPSGSLYKMYFLDFAQKDPPQIVPGQDPSWNITGAAWSPDGRKILFNYIIPEPPSSKPGDSSPPAKKVDAKAAERYSGVVVDPAGQPASGCRVWLFNAGPPWKGDVIEETVTGPEGRFASRTPWSLAASPSVKGPSVFVRDAKGRIGFLVRPQPDADPDKEPRFQLAEVGPFRGRLVDGSGRPLAHIKVWPDVLDQAEFPQGPAWLCSLPKVLQQKLEVRTGADGTFVLQGLPAAGTIFAKIEGGGYGHLDAGWAAGKPVTIALDRIGSVSGTVACPVGVAAEGLKVNLAPADRDPSVGRDYHLWLPRAAVTQKGGQFQIVNVIPGEYRLNVELKDQSAYHLDPEVLEVKPGQDLAGITIRLNPLNKP